MTRQEEIDELAKCIAEHTNKDYPLEDCRECTKANVERCWMHKMSNWT